MTPCISSCAALATASRKRLTILRDVADNPGSRVVETRQRVQKPRATVDRTLQALHMLGLLRCDEEKLEFNGKTFWERKYSLAGGISLDPLSPRRTNFGRNGAKDLFS
jgi:hypothetical protein